MITYIAITVGDMKTKLFLLKTNVLKFTQFKFLNAKIKEINVLLNFSLMFNMQALGYMAHIEMVFHFLLNLNNGISLCMVCRSGGCFENSV